MSLSLSMIISINSLDLVVLKQYLDSLWMCSPAWKLKHYFLGRG